MQGPSSRSDERGGVASGGALAKVQNIYIYIYIYVLYMHVHFICIIHVLYMYYMYYMYYISLSNIYIYIHITHYMFQENRCW